ncbi:MAG: hypothetical protein SFX73_30500 [Kofleriaceae bacterium]|nr:hypothetical protein [Kofleriaceae bacterium]
MKSSIARSRFAWLAIALSACEGRSERHEPPALERTREPTADLRLPPTMQEMLQDRPTMKVALNERPALARWLADRFAGVTGPGTVQWSGELPRSGQPGEHYAPRRPGDPYKLRVTDKYTGVDQLSVAVYELINMEGTPDFEDLKRRAAERTIEREAFAEAMTRREHAAVVTFRRVSRELALAPGPDDVVLARRLEAPDDFAAFEKQIAKYLREQGGGHDPRAYWRRFYDTLGATTPP